MTDPTDCSVEEVGTANYLKKICLNDGIKWYKCHNSKKFYTIIFYSGFANRCSNMGFDTLCPSDPNFYQACGHQECSGVKIDSSGNTMLCQTYICQHKSTGIIEAGLAPKNYRSCNSDEDCTNTNMDEQGCSSDNELQYHCRVGVTNHTIKAEQVCDNVCDCSNCNDESFCRGISYGVWCNKTIRSIVETVYVSSEHLCDNSKYCDLIGEDELNCTESHVIRKCKHPTSKQWRNLTAPQICAIPVIYETCLDGLDQVNCTDASRVALGCEIGGYRSNVSVFAICKGYGLCDDGYDDNCFEIENGCRVHKNLLCDGISDCLERSDEENEICLTLSKNNFCKRRLNPRDGNRKRSLNLPLSWVFDGVEDCENGEDENEQIWEICGKERYVRYFDKGTNCEDVLLCEDSDKKGYIMFSELCDKINTCGSENQMCQQSRGHFLLGGTKLGEHKSHKSIHYCLPGLNELTKIGPTRCTYGKHFEGPSKHAYFAFNGTFLDIPNKERSLDCLYTYGETYVYLSCSNICKKTTCPLKPIKHDTCNNHVDERVFSITEDNTLTVLYRQGQHYHDI